MTTHKETCHMWYGCPLKECHEPCTCSPDSAKEEWEERFDKLWEEESGMAMPQITMPFKDFIRSLLTTAREEGRQSCNKWHVDMDNPTDMLDPRKEIFEKGRRQGVEEALKVAEELPKLVYIVPHAHKTIVDALTNLIK